MQLRSHNRAAFNDSDQANDEERTEPASPKPEAAKQTRRAAACTSKPVVVEPDESDTEDGVQWESMDRYSIDSEITQPLAYVTDESDLNVNITQLSFGDDIPSNTDWEMLSPVERASNLRDEAVDRAGEPMEDGENDDFTGRFSFSSFGSGSTRSTFYRDDSPSPVSRPVGASPFETPKREVLGPANAHRLRFDNDSSDSEAEEPTLASSVSFKTASEGNCSERSSSHEGSNPRFWRAFSGTINSAALGDRLTERESGKERANDAGSFDVLSKISQKVWRMGVVRRASSPLTAKTNTTPEDEVTTNVKRRSQQVLSAIDENSSEPPLFTVIHGQPDGYTLTENNLGQGNFGTVNVAVREYAVKKVNAADPNAMSQCIEGVAVMRSVNHENIIRLKKAFHDVDNDIFYVMMEKMEGSIYQLIKFNGGYLTEEHALVILRCTAKALEYLHSRGFVHRDVKSDNVLVGRNCEVKLADLDSVAAENAWLNGVAGTPHWVAPEVARIVCNLTNAPYTAKVDVWSFAIFATEFALGVPPFFTGGPQPTAEICGTICNPQYVASVNDQVRRAGLTDIAKLVEYCLKENPAQRPRMSDILTVMSFLGEPDQQVLLEPIHRMLHRRAMTPNH